MDKKSLKRAALIPSLVFLAAWAGTPTAGPQRSFAPLGPVSRILHVQSDFGKMPVSFIPNRGQLDVRVAYYIQGRDRTIYFSPGGVTFALIDTDQGRTESAPANGGWEERFPTDQPVSPGVLKDGGRAAGSRWVVKLDFLDANPCVKPAGTDETGAVISYFSGQPENWKTGLSTCSRMVYRNLWPGIDLVYSGTMDELKSEFIVHPGADPSRIRLAYRGASSVLVDDAGRLVVSTPAGTFEDEIPVAYQELSGRRVPVSLAYEIVAGDDGRTAHDGRGQNEREAVVYGFSIGAYDQTRPLILDPVIVIYCGYIGGPDLDYGYGIAADSSGNAYIAGYTYSTGGFPATVGPDWTFGGGNVDAYVAKVNASGTALEYCGYIGGSGDDYGYGIAVDLSGNAYITGYTSSSEGTFPVRMGPDLTHNGLLDVFVAKVNASGTALEYCGYIGGSAHDYGRGIAVDGSGNAYITGSTYSTEFSFPVVVGPQLTSNGDREAFVAAVNASGTALSYCGYIGGTGEDAGSGIAVDKAGNAYITGYTNSPTNVLPAFPTTKGPFLTHNGGFDAFIAEVNTDGTALVYCTYIGGVGDDYGYGIAVDPSGSAYIAGSASSTEGSFPVSAGPDLTFNGSYYDAFVAKIWPEGDGLAYCGFIGGTQYDIGTGVAVDGRGYAYVTGYTSSGEDSFPVLEGPGLTLNGSFDVFVAKVDKSGVNLGFCGYFGGSEADIATGIALDRSGSGNIFLIGNTYSTESSLPVTVGPDLTHNGSRDGFVAKIYENTITVLSPNGYELWYAGLPENIVWLTTGEVGDVKIEYSTDNGTTWIEIVDSTENDGSYTWLVPATATIQALVRISEAEDEIPADTSDANFVIMDEPVIFVTAPNGGESWPVGSEQNITWVSVSVEDVKIEYTSDGGLNWTVIVDSTENDGIYTWIVPDEVSVYCRVRIMEATDGIPVDLGDDWFSIVPGSSSSAVKVKTPRSIKRGSIGRSVRLQPF
jgi:hypothetical protein